MALAIGSGNTEIAEFLVQQEFDMNFTLPPPQELNLLHFAVISKNLKGVEFCLENGISPLSETADHLTAIDLAEEKGCDETMRALLKHFARTPVAITNSDCETTSTSAMITAQLSDWHDHHGLLMTKRVELAFKKDSFLAPTTTLTVVVNENALNVYLNVEGLVSGTAYKYRLRCENENGVGEWSNWFEFETKKGEENGNEEIENGNGVEKKKENGEKEEEDDGDEDNDEDNDDDDDDDDKEGGEGEKKKKRRRRKHHKHRDDIKLETEVFGNRTRRNSEEEEEEDITAVTTPVKAMRYEERAFIPQVSVEVSFTI